MRISESGGELGIIKFIEDNYGSIEDDRVVVGLGDDAALLRTASDKLLVVTTDLLAEGTHFRRDIIDPYSLGWKSIAVNISDVAAMGGVPTWSFISIAFPDVEVSYIEKFYEGMNAISSLFGSRIIGGDTNRIEGNAVINVTQMGEVEAEYAARRTTAKPGDRILVTGNLGDSLAGLKILLGEGMEVGLQKHGKLVERHIRPLPRVNEAGAAVKTGGVCAMMDLSDGLGTDLQKMCNASGVGAQVDFEKVPVSDALRAAAPELGVDARTIAASGGEDYELLIAADPEKCQMVIDAVQSVTGTKVTDIGEFVEGNEAVIVHPDGRKTPLESGWKHF